MILDAELRTVRLGNPKVKIAEVDASSSSELETSPETLSCSSALKRFDGEDFSLVLFHFTCPSVAGRCIEC